MAPTRRGSKWPGAFSCPRCACRPRAASARTTTPRLGERLAGYRPDWIVLAGFMRVLSPGFVQRFAGRIVNIHPADTREHQGLHGYAWAFERGLAETKVTVHLVDEGLDTGRIVAQRAVESARRREFGGGRAAGARGGARALSGGARRVAVGRGGERDG
ncbi:MAG: formyltransferase family protein [Myxococcales bacterium]